jgi:hypothetical protein
VTVSELGFLAFGLLLGVVSGAALIAIVRARRPAAHEVRLTVAHDAIPRRRPSTLADDAFIAVGPEPARGGPADRRLIDGTIPLGAADRRTSVRIDPMSNGAARPAIPGAIPIDPGTHTHVFGRIMEPVFPVVGMPVSAVDGGLGLLRPSTAVAVLEAPRAASDRGGGASKPAQGAAATERCAEERRLADERCELATRARTRATAAADALRVAQGAYEAHEATAAAAKVRADPRAVHAAKDAAQGGFRTAVAAARGPDQLEAAARDWLTEINRINTEGREATLTASREHTAALAVAARLEQLGLDADAARIGADNADASCLRARSAVADCEERRPDHPEAYVTPPASMWVPRLDVDETLGIALVSGGTPRIFRLLRGDRAAMTTLVASLAGTEPDGRRRWQLLLTGLVEAIVADAIEASALEFPEFHTFWGTFSRTQSREIAHALSAIGYRFDGLGGWTDDRHPSQRELSLALGYAGIDPKRVRQWPNDEATGELFRDVRVAADEYLAGVAGDLTLAEMVGMLGRRADGLAEVWNQWGRIRSLLLDES